jgi:hypothetical protein
VGAPFKVLKKISFMCRPTGKFFVNIGMNEHSNSTGITHTTGIFPSIDRGKNINCEIKFSFSE